MLKEHKYARYFECDLGSNLFLQITMLQLRILLSFKCSSAIHSNCLSD
jgi:hypothetical protein